MTTAPRYRIRALGLIGTVLLTAPAAAQTRDSLLFGDAAAPFWAISVADLDRQLAWYRDTLGFTVFSQGAVEDRGVRYALLRQGAALIELLQFPGARPLRAIDSTIADPVQVHGFFKGGVVVADVEALFETLRGRGVRFAFPLGHPPGGPYRAFGVRDPEGNLLQFFGR